MSVPYFIKRNLRQKMVYWGNPKDNGEGGYTFDEPIEIKGRCEYRIEVVRTEKGEEKMSRARVYVDTRVDQGGYLFLGTLNSPDIGNTMHPEDTPEAMRILSLDEMPRLRNDGFMYKAFVNSNKYGNN